MEIDRNLILTEELKSVGNLVNPEDDNGCGSGWLSKFLCAIGLYFVHNKKGLVNVWKIHDYEYSIPYFLRSHTHKKQADRNLVTNFIRVVKGKENRKLTKYEKIFIRSLLKLLEWFGDRAYKVNHYVSP